LQIDRDSDTMQTMTTASIAIRSAKSGDSQHLADVHDAAWRFAYRGVLPGRELERMIARRGADWWETAIGRSVPVVVLEVDGAVRGYVTYGGSRVRSLPFKAEIYELYIKPEFTGLGFGRRLFRTVQERLSRRGHETLVVWCLTENRGGCAFYEKMGGQTVATAEEPFEGGSVAKVAYGFDRRRSAVRFKAR
jgi:ribosomal protein S18 acetylase RimI-like enzyme